MDKFMRVKLIWMASQKAMAVSFSNVDIFMKEISKRMSLMEWAN
jgi:hypothetical protein